VEKTVRILQYILPITWVTGLGIFIWDLVAGRPGVNPAIWGGTLAALSLTMSVNIGDRVLKPKEFFTRVFIWAWLMSIGVSVYAIFTEFDAVHPLLMTVCMLIIVAGYRAVFPRKDNKP
jgi:hypothetical protein